MAGLINNTQLSLHQQLLVLTAILLDGEDAKTYLDNDYQQSDLFMKVYKEIMLLEPSARIPYLGTMLRKLSKEIESGK